MPFLLPIAGGIAAGLGAGAVGAGTLASVGAGLAGASIVGNAIKPGAPGFKPGLGGTEGRASTDLSQYGNAPGSSSLSSMLAGMPDFKPITAGSISGPGSLYTASSPYKENAYQAKDVNQTKLPQYDAMRSRLDRQYSQIQDKSQEAIDRQFAAMGGGPGSGARIKQTENLATELARQKGEDLEGINAQEAQARFGLQQQEAERAFQSGEAQKGYGFQAGQADIGRQFQAGIAGAQLGQQAQQFNVGQSQAAQQFNTQMQQAQNQFRFGAESSIGQMNMQWQLAQQAAAENYFNAQMAQYQAQHSGGLFGGGGFLGLGF